ncbi:hypothetical protein MLD38_005093 [Melastoma candidum]|uniref:Uncharacterized protein n=1 Tax=Melastoma candidum TaxID=119954 RepID=A0ACB9S9B8_9MYRT|nr:hypothetical protein MLD38_005093 [Melastoma candidum]
MPDRHNNHHHHHHRPNRISVPHRSSAAASASYFFPTPTPTPSKTRPFSSLTSKSPFLPLPSSSSRSSLSFLFLILLSLRSLYSLIPFLRSSPSSFSVFPFSFLVSLFSFLLTLSFSLFPSPLGFSRYPSRVDAQERWFLRFRDLSVSQNRALVSKSVLLAGVFLVRLQALRYCGAAAMILAELSGSVAARFMIEGRNRDSVDYNWSKVRNSTVRGVSALVLGLLMLSFGWDRISCFPVRGLIREKGGVFRFLSEDCVRIWPMALPFISGFLGCYERISMDWNIVKELGKKRVRLISLLYTTLLLFVPAVRFIMVFEHDGDSISIGNLSWPLVNTVVFGVLLSENFSDEKLTGSGDFRREFLVTFGCTVVLDLVYFPELSLWGLTLCGMLLYVAVVELDPVHGGYVQMGIEQSKTFSFLVVNPLRHIFSETKSRKIALFLLINAGYMVVEFVTGFMCNSLGLISDACHMLFDCAALAIGLYASYISRLPANSQFNYGRGRFEVLSGYVNAVFLVLVGALIVLEFFERILVPQDISTNSLLAVSIGGLLVNMIGLIFFHEEHHHAHGGSCSHSHSPLDGHSPSHCQPHKNDHSVCHRPHEHKHDHHIHHECGSITSGTLEQLCPDDTHDHHHHHEHGSVTDHERTCCDHVHVNDHHDQHGHNMRMDLFFRLLLVHVGILVVLCSGCTSSVNAEVGITDLAAQYAEQDCVHLQHENWVLKPYFDKYETLGDENFDRFKKEELAPCACELVADNRGDPLKLSSLDRRLIGEGSHRRLSTSIRMDVRDGSKDRQLVESCKVVVIERLPAGVFADPFELQHLQELGVYGDVAVFGDTNLELPSFLSNRSAVEIHMDLHFKKASKLKGGLEINIVVPLHARYPAPGENGYSSVRFGDCDIFTRCSSKSNVRSEPCLSIPMAGAAINPIDGRPVWEIPCGIQAYAGFISKFTFLSVTIASVTIIASSLFCSRKSPGNIKNL